MSLWKDDAHYGYLDVDIVGDEAVLTFRTDGGDPLFTCELSR